MKRFFALLLLMPSLGFAATEVYQQSYDVYSALVARVSLPYYSREIPPPPRHYRHRHENHGMVRKPRGHSPSMPVAPRAHGHDNHANNAHGHQDRKYYPPRSPGLKKNPSSQAHGHD